MEPEAFLPVVPHVLPQYIRRSLLTLVILIAAVALLFTAGVLWPEPVLTPARTTSPVAFVDVAVVDVDKGELITAQTVVVHAGRIYPPWAPSPT